ncbi:MAG: cytochrome c [Gammaproteobacteria bacterium]
MTVSRYATLLTSLGLLLAANQPTCAADVEAGKAVANTTCLACHGANGIGIIPLYPNLAGQKAEYLEVQLRAYRSGERKNPIMAPMSASLSDADIRAVAAYYSTLRNP